VRQVLQSRNLPFADRVSPPLIVVPVYERAGTRLLWETPNDWDSAWRARVGAQGLVQTAIAAGAPAEQLIVSADQALAGDAARLQALAQAYDARGAVVALARFRIDPLNGQPSVEATLTGFGVAPPGPLTRTFVGNAGLAGGIDQAARDLTAAAATGLSEMLAEAWKLQNIASTGRGVASGGGAGAVGGSSIGAGGVAGLGPGQLLVTSPLARLGDFANLQRQLREVPAVAGFTVARLTATEATLRLSLRVPPAEAKAVFAQYGMALVEGPGVWTLRAGG
jgi:hypothetical protein